MSIVKKNEKLILYGIFAISLVVLITVVGLSMIPKSETIPFFVPLLPKLNALINGTCSILLLLSLYFIRNKKVEIHKRINIITFLLSSLFFISYITFHSYGIETRFPAENTLRPFYLIILISHIILAAIVLPLILMSFYFGLTNQVKTHRKLARWTFPIWLYVTVSGVAVYLMISPYYNF